MPEHGKIQIRENPYSGMFLRCEDEIREIHLNKGQWIKNSFGLFLHNLLKKK